MALVSRQSLLKLVYRFPNNPFGVRPTAPAESYLDLFMKHRGKDDAEVRLLEADLGFRVDAGWLDQLALQSQVVVKPSALNWNHGKLLYAMSRHYICERNNKDSSVVFFETGSGRGFSAVVMAKALIDSGQNGVVVSLDSLPPNRKIFWNSYKDAEGPRSRSELLSDYAEELSRVIFIQGWTPRALAMVGIERINFAFLDGAHTKKDVLAEFSYVSARQEVGDVVVFDDVTPSLFPGVCEAVSVIAEEKDYSVALHNSESLRGYAIGRKIR